MNKNSDSLEYAMKAKIIAENATLIYFTRHVPGGTPEKIEMPPKELMDLWSKSAYSVIDANRKKTENGLHRYDFLFCEDPAMDWMVTRTVFVHSISEEEVLAKHIESQDKARK